MAKKKKTKFKRHAFRNAVAPRPRSAKPVDVEDPTLKKLAYTIGGAGGAALALSFMQHEGWSPKTVAAALGAAGGALAWKAKEDEMKSLGSAVASAAVGQLASIMIAEHDAKAADATKVASNDAKPADALKALPAPRQADALPPGALENALARAQARLAISDAELVG
jgi:hypothetical protein